MGEGEGEGEGVQGATTTIARGPTRPALYVWVRGREAGRCPAWDYLLALRSAPCRRPLLPLCPALPRRRYGVPAGEADRFEEVARRRVYTAAVANLEAGGTSEAEVRPPAGVHCSVPLPHLHCCLLLPCLLSLKRSPMLLCRCVGRPSSKRVCPSVCCSLLPVVQVWGAVERALMGKTTMFSPRLLVESGE